MIFTGEFGFYFRGKIAVGNIKPRQILIFEALGMTPPQYAHLPMILGEDKKKLSKRRGAKSLDEYRKEGYLPEVLFNFLALLGWNPGTPQELFTKDELIQSFDLDKVQKEPEQVDPLSNLDQRTVLSSQPKPARSFKNGRHN